MPLKYREIYPSAPQMNSYDFERKSASALMTLEYFQAEPGEMPEAVYAEHHVLINLNERPQRFLNWRDGKLLDYISYQNDIVLTPAGIKSGWKWQEKSDVIVITLDPKLLGRFAETELGILLSAQQIANEPRKSDAEVCNAAVNLRDVIKDGGIGSDVMFESLSRVFLVKLLKVYGEVHIAHQRGRKSLTAEQYRKVLEYVSTNLARSIQLNELAKIAAMSPSHFSRLFKSTIGSSPMNYVMTYRIEQAVKRMRNRGNSLSQIAFECGFADQAHFSRAFKKVMGQTPKKFQRECAR